MSCGIIKFAGKDVLIVGGGIFAYQKACEFINDGANVSCFSSDFIEIFDTIEIKRIYGKEDLDVQYFIVYAATQDRESNHQIVLDTNAKGIMSASYHKDDDAVYSAMKFEKFDDLTVALYTAGKFPAFSKTVFDDIRNVYEERYNQKLNYLGTIRDYIVSNNIERKYLLEDLLSSSIEELKFYCDSIKYGRATVLVFHGVKKNEMYIEILRFIRNMDIQTQGVYFAYLDEVALKEYNYFVELNRIISLDKMMRTLDLLCIERVEYQPMLFEKGDYYNDMEIKLKGHTILPLLFDKRMLEALLISYLPKGQNVLVVPELKSNTLIDLINSLNIECLSVMKLNDPLPVMNKSSVLHVSGFFVLMGEELLRQVFGKDGVYMHLIETDYDAEMNKCILIQSNEFIQCVKSIITK